MSYLKPDQIEKLREALDDIEPRYNRLLLTFRQRRFSSEQAAEYALHGYLRRLGTLKRCIDNVFALISPDESEIPERNVLHDAQINIQAFFANVYGCVDNLAWVWVHERGLTKISRNRVGLRAKHTELRSTLSANFQAYLQNLDPWLEYLIEYRDALAHRIPLYIPPGGVPTKNVDDYNALSQQIVHALYVQNDGFEYERLSAEQEKLLVFQPLITHSVTETTAHFAFHVQMPTDFLTVEEMGYKMLDELS
ncbi:hypothetical protein N2603_20340 [Bradyrhizobium huanghuaihaiense]|uniref:hypothetical protein n=1 Tax=Bradyrhizobium huanghuaihaiense TaxID=990078 RepID=UPI0021A9F9DC|nr:hypothetical protein [Bradyrhizobium sp. CB3035]UWU80725.1 hypothetical protein N2603_20340 [Bradyrhizobium sp. CB3035]